MWKSPRCQAKCRTRSHQACRNLAMANGRCRMHGGKARGPKTERGKTLSGKANSKHGLYSNRSAIEKQSFRKMIKDFTKNLEAIIVT
ncbi:HGGxSTG domain-containing protein [Candidatus Protochlamydia sp. W-9]|uniref:HGGxSTG domain-containing protein n=1 Tax=Candidatus Protochlamydia sp. W-9 TaxID=1785087 RepID=UPI00096A4C00|nr:HGGxSTG domain-containing protein [Candidatus Protochlamydia sp. W-9]